MDKAGQNFVGLANYRWALSDGQFRQSIFNNLLWLLVVPAVSTAMGLIIAVLTDRIWWGNIAKSLIFMPLAISFVGASVIWKFVYDYRGEGQEQIGLLNAIVDYFGGSPQVWIALPFWNNFFLMVILIWIQTGFATVILAAALRGIPEDTLEAAIIDGAGPFKIFFRIMIPQIAGTIIVVWTTITVLVLKVFDIVLTMTNGQWNTQVLANLMFDWMFRGGGDFGRGAAIAIVNGDRSQRRRTPQGQCRSGRDGRQVRDLRQSLRGGGTGGRHQRLRRQSAKAGCLSCRCYRRA
jgi:alpha-glucoside transport system permease protein